jgi:beta-N-acetylhexosaminidase
MTSGRATPSPAAARRRRALLGAALAALALGLLVGSCAGSSDGDEGGASAMTATASTTAPTAATPLGAARRDVAGWSLRRQVGETLVISFSGTSAPSYVLDALHDGRAAGVILFGGNAPNATSVRALTARLQQAAGGRAIVSLDQEGGEIRTLAFAPSAVGQAGQPTPAAARAAAASTARALRAVGVNVALGPVADVASSTSGSVMAGRAYPGGGAAVAASVRAAVAAYDQAGVLPVPKHFPGLGGATANTDDAGATVGRSRAQLAGDLLPYRTAEAPLVMIGHARYPALDADRIASQSRPIVTGLLRGELGFDGVAMTDSLEAQAVLDTTGGDVGAAAARSMAAGVDLLLMTGPGSFPRVRDALLAQARRSPIFRKRVAEAAAHVLALRRELP